MNPRQFRTGLLAAAFWLCGLAAAEAVSLQNKDNQSYDIRVTGSSTMTGSINGGVIKNGICRKACTIEVEGVGSIDADGSDRVVIRSGRLSK